VVLVLANPAHLLVLEDREIARHHLLRGWVVRSWGEPPGGHEAEEAREEVAIVRAVHAVHPVLLEDSKSEKSPGIVC